MVLEVSEADPAEPGELLSLGRVCKPALYILYMFVSFREQSAQDQVCCEGPKTQPSSVTKSSGDEANPTLCTSNMKRLETRLPCLSIYCVGLQSLLTCDPDQIY